MERIEKEINERYEFPEYCMDDLADQIQAKRTAFKCGVLFAQRWIPIEDELPTENGKYLVLKSNGDWASTYFEVETKSFVNYYSDLYNFTHWRPISFLQ